MRQTRCPSGAASGSVCPLRPKPSACCQPTIEGMPMSSKPICIAQISDLHIKREGELAYARVDTAQALARCVAALNGFDPVPDFVVISGDLVDTPTEAEYEHLKQLLAPLKLPFAGVPGNHDARDMMQAAFPDQSYAMRSGALNQKVEL